MAHPIYMKIAGVAGDCDRTDRKEWIEILNYSQAVSRPERVGAAPQFMDFAVNKYTDRSSPLLALACFERGLAHQRKGEVEQALAAYSEAIRLEPTLVRPYHFRGRLLTQRRDYPGAVADLLDLPARLQAAMSILPTRPAAISHPARPLSGLPGGVSTRITSVLVPG